MAVIRRGDEVSPHALHIDLSEGDIIADMVEDAVDTIWVEGTTCDHCGSGSICIGVFKNTGEALGAALPLEEAEVLARHILSETERTRKEAEAFVPPLQERH